MNKIKRILLTSVIASLIFVAQPQKAEAVNLGPFKVAIGFCEQIQKITSILNVYTMVQWPVVGFPGITMGLAQNTSAILDLCNFITQLEQLDTADAIFFTGAKLNDMTGKKWDHHLEMADKTWNLANSVYDFESGTMKKGAMSSQQTHRDMADFMTTSYSWYNKTFNGKDAKLKTRGEREQDMNNFAGAAYRRAILKEATNCPDGYGNTNYEKAYANEIKPWEVKRDDATDDVNYFRGKLLEMGPRFMNSQGDLTTFNDMVEKMMTQGVTYNVAIKPKTEQTSKPGTKKDANNHVIMEKTNLKKDTQVWTVKLFSDVFEDFKKKWGPQWGSWVTAQFLSRGTDGILDDPKGRVEAEFQDLNYECNASRLMKGVSSDRPDYEKLQEERVTKCKDDTKINQKKAENLLNYYAVQMQNSIYALKQANANIWTKESWYLGTMRAVNTKDSTEGFQQEQVACSDGKDMTPSESSKLGLKEKAVGLEYKEFISKQYMKKTMLMEAKSKNKVEENEEAEKRRAFAEKQSKRSTDDLKNNIAPIAVDGGI